jgi:Uma2 family endonuclease
MLPAYNYSYARARLIGALLKLEDFTAFSQLTLRLEGQNYSPDVCMYPKREVNLSLPEPIEMTVMPVLAVEVLSHTETLQEILDRFTVYFDAIIKSCWLVVPIAGAVIVYSSVDNAQLFRAGNIIDEQLNIQLPLEDIFD